MSNRKQVLKTAAALCIGAAVIGVAAWSWKAFAPTGLSAEMSRVEAKYADLKATGRRLPATRPPIKVATQVTVFPGDEAITELESQVANLTSEIVDFLRETPGAMALFSRSRPQATIIRKSVAPPIDDRIWERADQLPAQLLEDLEGRLTSRSGASPVSSVSDATRERILSLAMASRELDRKVIELLPDTPDSSLSRLPVASPLSSCRLLAEIPIPGDSSSTTAVAQLATLFADDLALGECESGELAPARRAIIALLSMDAEQATSEARSRVSELIDEVEARYADAEWQRAQWESSVIAEHHRQRFIIERVPYSGSGGTADFILNGAPLKLLAELYRPIILRESDVGTAALLRNDPVAAFKSAARLANLQKTSGIRVWLMPSVRTKRMEDRMRRGEPPFAPVEIQSFTNVLRIVAAMSFFHADEGREPRSLEELTPKYLELQPTGNSRYSLIEITLPEGRVPFHGSAPSTMGIVWVKLSHPAPGEPDGPRDAIVHVIVPTKSMYFEDAKRTLMGETP